AVLGTLVPYLRPYSLRIGLALAMILVAKLVLLLVPVVMKLIVDRLALMPSLLLVPVALLLSYGAARIGTTLFTELRQVVLAPVILVWAYDWGFAAITLATLTGYALWTFAVTEWRTRYFRAAVDADTRANERAVDSLLNYETVKYFNNEAHEAALYDERLR